MNSQDSGPRFFLQACILAFALGLGAALEGCRGNSEETTPVSQSASQSAQETTPSSVSSNSSGDFVDVDGDGVPQDEDNCPTVPNPDQSDLDEGIMIDARPFIEGDACDDDMDGDQVPNDQDRFPRDTDNDGEDNEVDDDDDGDGIEGEDDNCVIVANEDQKDTDADGGGDVCDGDKDGDGEPDLLEGIYGSDPLDPHSTVEYVGYGAVCEDNQDNDGDGKRDSDDEGCVDSDGDTYADYKDNCPEASNKDQLDTDDDDVGDACDPDSTGAG